LRLFYRHDAIRLQIAGGGGGQGRFQDGVQLFVFDGNVAFIAAHRVAVTNGLKKVPHARFPPSVRCKDCYIKSM